MYMRVCVYVWMYVCMQVCKGVFHVLDALLAKPHISESDSGSATSGPLCVRANYCRVAEVIKTHLITTTCTTRLRSPILTKQ